jgi:hypothetical protein
MTQKIQQSSQLGQGCQAPTTLSEGKYSYLIKRHYSKMNQGMVDLQLQSGSEEE